MSDLKSKVAYLQGLSNGMELDVNSKEGRLLSNIIEVLDDFAETVSDLESSQEELEDYVETIDDDLFALESDFNGGDDHDYIEVNCPRCGEAVLFEPDIIDDEDVIEVTCPNCDEVVFINDDNFGSADEPEGIENNFPAEDL
ncbi:MAG: AraC family transcriptional regulator [Firmicutes bacterium]|nr:AraC family transcriptional regulator [Bacillota bacterium]